MDLIKNLSLTYTKHLKKLKGSSLNAQTARGGIWLGVGTFSENGLRFLRNIILVRILVPDDFGLMAIIMAVNQLFETFTQIGIKEAVIQNPKGNETIFLNGAFFISLIRGLLLFFIAFFTVPFVAKFYSKPELIPMMRITFLTIIFNGAMSPRAYSALKKMNFKKWVIVFHGGCVCGIISAIIFGFFMRNIWALVLGFTIEGSCRLIFSYIVCPFFPRLSFNKEYIRSLLKFIKGMFGLPILYYLFTRIDIFVLGKYCTDAELGMYSLVQNFADIPFILYRGIINQLFMPVFSSLHHDIGLLRAKYSLTIKYLSYLSLPALTLLGCFAPYILAFVYDEYYAGGASIYAIFCACVALRIIGACMASLFFALGKPAIYRTALLVRCIVMLLIIIPSVYAFGITGAAFSGLFALIIWFFIVLSNVKNVIMLSYSKQFRLILPGIVISLIIYLIYRGLTLILT